MPVDCKVRKERGVTIISVHGQMVVGQKDLGLMSTVVDHLKNGESEFVIDLGHVEALDSAGVGELVAANVAAKERDAELHLANLDDSVGKVLQMALVHKIIQTFDTQKEAVADFVERRDAQKPGKDDQE